MRKLLESASLVELITTAVGRPCITSAAKEWIKTQDFPQAHTLKKFRLKKAPLPCSIPFAATVVFAT